MDGQAFITYADKLRRGTRDGSLIEFLDFAVGLAQRASPKKAGKFDRNAYQRDYMRRRRAAKKSEALRAKEGK